MSKSEQPEGALVLQGARARGQRLDPAAGRQHGALIKMKGKNIRAAFLCGEKREV